MPLTWNPDPIVAISLLFPTWAYAHGVMHLWRRRVGSGVARWQVACYSIAILALGLALISPIDTLSAELLSVHMIQHLLLTIVAPPLLVMGVPSTIFLWVFPVKVRRTVGRWGMQGQPLAAAWHFITRPLVAWSLHAAALWVWHVPGLYEAAVENRLLHMLEHASFFITALIFWYSALRSASGHRFVGALMVATTAMHTSILGALMTFANTVWYPVYAPFSAAWGVTPIEDQQLAGLVMWVPGGIVYVIVMLFLIAHGLNAMEQSDHFGIPNS